MSQEGKNRGDPGPVVQPHSRASEEALLGAILIDGELLQKLNVLPEEFYMHRHAWVWEAALDLRARGSNVDIITLTSELERRGRLAEVGGTAYLIELINRTASSLNAESYAAVVKEKARRRGVLAAAARLAAAALQPGESLENAISQAIDSLSRAMISDKAAVHIQHFVSQVFDEVKKAIDAPCELFGIPTGFADWDRITGGLQKGEVCKLSGEPGLGKSLLAVQVLCSAASAGHPGVLYELEMSGRQIVRRQVSAISKIPTRDLRSGFGVKEKADALVAAVNKISLLPVYVSDCSVLTTAELRADLARLKDAHKVEVCVIDYEGLLADEPNRDEITRSRLISSRVHAVFKDLDIAGLVIDDMNKGGIGGTVQGKAGLSGSARKLHDADQIVIMRRHPDDPKKVRLTWEKMREGESDRFLELVRVQGFPAFEGVRHLP